MTKTNTQKKNTLTSRARASKAKLAWVLKSKVTGKIYPTFTYATRSAARKAAQGRRFKGEYTPVKFMTTQTKNVTPNEVTLKAMKEAAPILHTATQKTLNRTPILRKSSGSPRINSFPIHQRWM